MFAAQEAEAIDFSLPGEGTVNSVEEAMAQPAESVCGYLQQALSTGRQRCVSHIWRDGR